VALGAINEKYITEKAARQYLKRKTKREKNPKRGREHIPSRS